MLMQQNVVYVYFECHRCEYTARIVESAMTIAKNISYTNLLMKEKRK